MAKSHAASRAKTPAGRPAAARPNLPAPAKGASSADIKKGLDRERDPNNDAVTGFSTAQNPAPQPGKTSTLHAPRPAVTSLERDAERRRTAESLEDRNRGHVDSKVGESAGQRRAARARVLADVEPGGDRYKVVATQAGYYDHARRREGDVFTIAGEKYEDDVKSADGKKVMHKKGDVMAFSSRWMRYVDGDEPETLTSSNEVIKQRNDELKELRRSGIHVPVGEPNVEDTGDNPIDGD